MFGKSRSVSSFEREKEGLFDGVVVGRRVRVAMSQAAQNEWFVADLT